MLKVRISFLLVLCLIFTGSSLAKQGTMEDKVYYQEVILPAIQTGSLTAEMRGFLKDYKIRNKGDVREFESGDNEIGPRRDDAGDILAEYEAPASTIGLAWDPDHRWMWGYDHNNGRLYALNPEDGEIVANFGVARQRGGLFYLNDVLHIGGHWGDPQNILRYDTDGNQLEALHVPPANPLCITTDGEFLFILSLVADAEHIHVYNLDDMEEMATIAYREVVEETPVAIEWVTVHPDGQLWLSGEDGRFYQCFVDDDWNCELVQDFETVGDGFCGLAHDGDNLWRGLNNNNIWYVIDDGVVSWLSYDPAEGEVEPDDQMVVTVILDATDAENGDYEAEIHFLSNDPENQDIVVSVFMHVGIRSVESTIHFEQPDDTGRRHTLVVEDLTLDGELMRPNSEIGVFTLDGFLAGAAVYQGEDPTEFRVWGDDPDTDEVDGFTNDELFTFLAWDEDTDEEYTAEAEFLDGPSRFVNNGSTTLNIHAITILDFTVSFTRGWNMISLNITPTGDYWDEREDRGPDIRGEGHLMLQPFLDDDDNQRIIIMKDERGDFCAPAWDFYGIPFWNLAEGYYFKVFEDIEATWTGSPINPQTEIGIDAGWNMIAYYPDYDLPADRESNYYVLSPIIDHVVIAKNGEGDFLSPRWGYSNMDPWTPGQGYQINVDEDVVLVYPEAMDEGAMAAVNHGRLTVSGGVHWTTIASTGENMSVLVTSVAGLVVEDGDQIAAFDASDRLVGVGRFTGSLCGLAVWGDNRLTEDVVEGLQASEAFELRLWDADKNEVMNLNLRAIKSGNDFKYMTDELTVLDVAVETPVPGEYQLSQCRPNPFNAMTVVSYGLPEAAQVMIRIFDVTGRQVAVLVDDERQAGSYAAVWDGRSVASGVYIVWMEAGSFKAARKVMLVK